MKTLRVGMTVGMRSFVKVMHGMASIESSERLLGLLAKHGISHEVLNAKNHEHEAAIVAQAGRAGAVTVTANRRDGRSSLLSIRAGAEDEVSEILRGVEAAAIGGMRPIRYDERSLYYKIVDQTVAALRVGLT